MTDSDDIQFESLKSDFLSGRADFRDVLISLDSGAAPFAVDVLRGRHGAEACRAAHKLMSVGIGFGGDFDYMQPIADHLLMVNRLPMLKAIVMAGMPPVFLETWLTESPCPASRIEWLDELSTSRHGPPEVDGELEAEKSFLRFAAWRLSVADSDIPVATNTAAIEFVWELDRHHMDFARLAAEASPEGSVIRQFLMERQLQAAGTPVSTAAAPSRARRAKP